MIKNQKGVTLIALVITIIVLLILAGVSITMLSGNESTPEKANEAAIKSALGDAKDAINIAATEAMQDYYDQKYVQGDNTAVAKCGIYVSTQLETYETSDPEGTECTVDQASISGTTYTAGSVTLKSTRDNTYIVTGTINENGGITWVNSWDS